MCGCNSNLIQTPKWGRGYEELTPYGFNSYDLGNSNLTGEDTNTDEDKQAKREQTKTIVGNLLLGVGSWLTGAEVVKPQNQNQGQSQSQSQQNSQGSGQGQQNNNTTETDKKPSVIVTALIIILVLAVVIYFVNKSKK